MKFRLSFALVALALVAAGCGDDDPAPATTGQIGVTTVTTGDDIDADGYTITVDGDDGGAIGVNATVILPNLSPATYSVGLSGLAANCAVGDNPRDVAVTAGATENTTFSVVCSLLNQPPVADAGLDQTVTDADNSGSEDVTLDGSASIDADGTIASWVWTEGGLEIASGEAPTATFAVGVHTVVLTVTDDGGATGTDEVMVTVEAFVGNQDPTADAGPDQTITDADNSGDEDVTLDGSASTDDGTIVSYSWSENSVEFSTEIMPTVTLAVGAHTITLTVTDDEGATGTDDVAITVNAPTVFFATDILPYFEAAEANCVQCHSGGTGIFGVNLDSYTAVLTDGNNGPLVVPGDSADPTALLLPKVLADHNDGPDDAAFAATLATWIDEGALDN
jgi:hypothetical protein